MKILKFLLNFIKLQVAIFFVLLILPFPFTDLPFLGDYFYVFYDVMDAVVLWFGHHILNVQSLQIIEMTGSGDTTFDYVNTLFLFILSIALAAGSYYLAFIKNHFTSFQKLSIVYVRYFVGFMLLTYGISKFTGGQFGSPTLGSLEQSLGNGSPMGLLWNFMGYSKPYTLFTGIMEVSAGLLLLFRRTYLIGALISVAVMTNVMMLNFCYDVPVKLFSTQLNLMSLYLLLPFAKSFFNYFILGKESKLEVAKLHFNNKRNLYFCYAAKYLFIGVSLFTIIRSDWEYMISENSENPIVGVYKPTDVISSKNEIDYSNLCNFKWSKIIIDKYYAVLIQSNQQSDYYQIGGDTSIHLLTLKSYKDTSEIYNFNYLISSDSTVIFNGIIENDNVSIHCSKKTADDYLLINRGFHWIQEYPFNR